MLPPSRRATLAEQAHRVASVRSFEIEVRAVFAVAGGQRDRLHVRAQVPKGGEAAWMGGRPGGMRCQEESQERQEQEGVLLQT